MAYGAKPYSVIDVIPLPLPAKALPIALDMVEHMQQVHKEVKKRIEAANARHKAKTDIHRRRVTFPEGDLVWVILTKKRQPSSVHMKGVFGYSLFAENWKLKTLYQNNF